MMFIFAYLGQFGDPKGWPVALMHTTEVLFYCFCNRMCILFILL
jgi:hypothetical protein